VTHLEYYERKELNGENIIVVYQPEGIAPAKAKFPELTIYSFKEIEALEGLNREEQKLLQEAKVVFGGGIFTEESFNQYYPTKRSQLNVKRRIY
jgi:hypothetical protein